MHSTSETSHFAHHLFLPEDAGVLTRVKLAVRALKVLAKHKDDGIAAPILNVSVDAEVFARLIAELAQSDDGRELLRARPNLQSGVVDLSALQQLPQGTLGHSLARYYLQNGIKPFESPYPIRNDVDYLAKRYRETHDLVHVLTGYGTDPIGEMELQAFAFGNLGLRQCIMILTFAAVFRTDGLPPIWTYTQKLRAAYLRGRRCKNIVRPRYEQYWESPVDDVRRQLTLDPMAQAARA